MRAIHLSNVAYPDTQREQSRGYRNNFIIEKISKKMRSAFEDAGLTVPEIDALAITRPRNDDVCVPGQNHYACECTPRPGDDSLKGKIWPRSAHFCGPVG